MRRINRSAASAFVVLAFSLLASGFAQGYEPVADDDVVVYVNKFNGADFERAKQIMVEGFGGAMSASGQVRRTYWIANPETHEIVGISFFQKDHGVDEWHDHDHRQAVLDQLEPLRSAPLELRHYKVLDMHKANH